MATCLRCLGTKHIFIDVRITQLYPDGSYTRIYLGKCDVCDPEGEVKLTPDCKQAQAGERAA